MKRILKTITASLIAAVTLVSVISASAEIPCASYTYWDNIGDERKEVYNRAMYSCDTVLNAEKLGISAFKELNDVCTDSDGRIYLLDSSSRISVFDGNYSLLYEIHKISGKESYDDAKSIYIHTDKTIYICDTEGRRILHSTLRGELINIITLPDSSLLPDNFDFRPIRIAIDEKGCTYILSEGSYYGALLYDENGKFIGFYGANTVTAGIAGVMSNIMGRIFPNNAKRANTASRIPYSFVDIKSDNDGFIYTCNGKTERYQNKGQIRKLSPGTGRNILESEDVNFTDTPVNRDYSFGAFASQDILNIEIDGSGYIYALESVFGKVFLYDGECRMITAFGGGMHEGTQRGSFVNVSGMALLDDGDRVIVSDSVNNDITVFKINDYGKEVKRLDALTMKGKYAEAKAGWQKVLKEDNCIQAAYSGMANAFIDEGNYKEAMKYAYIGYFFSSVTPSATGGQPLQLYAMSKDKIHVAHGTMALLTELTSFQIALTAVVFAAIIAGLVISKRRSLNLVKSPEIRLMLGTMIHPSESFGLVKEKGMGSVGIGIILALLFYASAIILKLGGGFLFTQYDPETFNSLWVMARTIGIVVLWIAANWFVCTLMGGKGKLREIIIITCYSLLPLILKNFITVILTNVLLPTEANFLSILSAVSVIYFVLLMICGLIKIHDFSFGRMLSSSFLSLLGVGIIFFLIVMIIILFQQAAGFAVTVISELLTL